MARAATAGNGKGVTFLRTHVAHDGDDCLIWPYYREGPGYGVCAFEGRSIRASRLMCMLVYGPPPTPKHEAAHSCGNGHGGCVNPRHLSWKDRSANQQDRWQHRRKPRPYPEVSKINAEHVREIKSLAATTTITDLAKMFGVSRGTIRNVLIDYTRTKKPKHRFTDDEVQLIRRREKSIREMAEDFGIGRAAIENVLCGRTYRYVPAS